MQLRHHAHPYLAYFSDERKRTSKTTKTKSAPSTIRYHRRDTERDDHISTATTKRGIFIEPTQ